MPHQCVKCNTIYDDGAQEIIQGCECGASVFFYIRDDQMEEAKEQVEDLSDEDKEQIEEDVYDIIGEEKEPDKPVVLDFEAVNISQPGTYEIDLVKLFKEGEPLIYRMGDGKYVVDLKKSFEKMKKKPQD